MTSKQRRGSQGGYALLFPARWQCAAHPCTHTHTHTGHFVAQTLPHTHTHTIFPPNHPCFLPAALHLPSFIFLFNLTLICSLWMGQGLGSRSLTLWSQGAGGWSGWAAGLGRLGEGSHWWCEARLQDSFLWKWINVNLLRMGAALAQLWACSYWSLGMFLISRSFDMAPMTSQGCRFPTFPSGSKYS